MPVPVHRLRELPDGTDPRLGALAEPLANGVHAARIGRAGVEAGPTDRVVVLGAGTIGLMTLQAALIGGASWAGVLDIHPARRAAAEALGAHATFGSPETVPGGADLVFDAVGKESTRRLAIDLLRPGGCAVMIGLATESTPIRFDEVIRGGLTVRGAYAYSRRRLRRGAARGCSTAAPGSASSSRCSRSTPARTRSRSSPPGPRSG